MTTQLDPFGMPADAELAQILAPGFLLDDLADEIPVADPLTLDPEADRPMTEEEFAAYDKWVTEQEAEWIRKNGPVPF